MTNSGSIPAGTRMTVSAEQYDAATEALAAKFVEHVHPAMRRDVERTFRQSRAALRSALSSGELGFCPVTRQADGSVVA